MERVSLKLNRKLIVKNLHHLNCFRCWPSLNSPAEERRDSRSPRVGRGSRSRTSSCAPLSPWCHGRKEEQSDDEVSWCCRKEQEETKRHRQWPEKWVLLLFAQETTASPCRFRLLVKKPCIKSILILILIYINFNSNPRVLSTSTIPDVL